MDVDVWDCAGQEVYYPAHQYFLTDRSIVVVVWRLGEEGWEDEFREWIDNLRQRNATRVQFLLVATHLDHSRYCNCDKIEEMKVVTEDMRKAHQKFVDLWMDWSPHDKSPPNVYGMYVVRYRTLALLKDKYQFARISVEPDIVEFRYIAKFSEEIARAAKAMFQWDDMLLANLPPGHVPGAYMILRRIIDEQRDLKHVSVSMNDLLAMTGDLFESKGALESAIKSLNEFGVVAYFPSIDRDSVYVSMEWIKDIIMLPLSIHHAAYPDRDVKDSKFVFEPSILDYIKKRRGYVERSRYKVRAADSLSQSSTAFHCL